MRGSRERTIDGGCHLLSWTPRSGSFGPERTQARNMIGETCHLLVADCADNKVARIREVIVAATVDCQVFRAI